MNPASLDEFRRQHGEWTAMSVHLGGDLYTLPPAPDGRLLTYSSPNHIRPSRQASCPITGAGFGLLEGHYGIENV